MQYRKPTHPVLNKKHPICRGLAFDMPFFEKGGGIFHDVASGYIGKASASNDPLWITSPFGPAIQFQTSGGNNRIDVTSDRAGPIEAIQNLTVQAIVRSDAVDSNAFITKGPFPNGTNGPYWEFRQDRSTNSWACDFDWGNNPGWGSTNGANSGDGKWHNVFMSIGRLDSSAAAPDFMMDGILENSYAFAVSPTGSFVADTNGFTIGNGDDSGTLNAEVGGSIALLRVWNRQLTRHEKFQLTQDPFQLYIQDPWVHSLNSIAVAIVNHWLSLTGVGT